MIPSERQAAAVFQIKMVASLILSIALLAATQPCLATPADKAVGSKGNHAAKPAAGSAKPSVEVEDTTITTTTTKSIKKTNVVGGTDQSHVTATSHVHAGGKPQVIDFSAVWCVPCKKMSPMFHKLESDYAGKAEFQSVDFDKDTKLVAKYGVTSVPTIIIINSAGKIAYKHTGLIEEKTMTAELDKVVVKK